MHAASAGEATTPVFLLTAGIDDQDGDGIKHLHI